MVIQDRHSSKLTDLGIMYHSIHLHDSLTRPMKSGVPKYLNIKIQPEVWLVVVYWHMEV